MAMPAPAAAAAAAATSQRPRPHHRQLATATRRHSAASGSLALVCMGAAVMALSLGSCQAKATAGKCIYTARTIAFDPWEAWGIFSNEVMQLDGQSQVEGRVAGGTVNVLDGTTVNTGKTTFAGVPYALTASVSVNVMLSVVEGGVEAQDEAVFLSQALVKGNVRAGGDRQSLFDGAVVTGTFESKVGRFENGALFDPSNVADTVIKPGGVEKSVNLDDAMTYFKGVSSYYSEFKQDAIKVDTTTAPGEIRVTLHNQVNFADVTMTELAAANKIVLSGIPNAVVIFNIRGDGTVRTSRLDVVYQRFQKQQEQAPPTFNRVLLHFPAASEVLLGPKASNFMPKNAGKHNATTTTAAAAAAAAMARVKTDGRRRDARVAGAAPPPAELYFSVLAPNAVVSLSSVIVRGNVIGNNVGMTSVSEVQTQPWGRLPLPPKGKPQPTRPDAVSSKCLWGKI